MSPFVLLIVFLCLLTVLLVILLSPLVVRLLSPTPVDATVVERSPCLCPEGGSNCQEGERTIVERCPTSYPCVSTVSGQEMKGTEWTTVPCHLIPPASYWEIEEGPCQSIGDCTQQQGVKTLSYSCVSGQGPVGNACTLLSNGTTQEYHIGDRTQVQVSCLVERQCSNWSSTLGAGAEACLSQPYRFSSTCQGAQYPLQEGYDLVPLVCPHECAPLPCERTPIVGTHLCTEEGYACVSPCRYWPDKIESSGPLSALTSIQFYLTRKGSYLSLSDQPPPVSPDTPMMWSNDREKEGCTPQEVIRDSSLTFLLGVRELLSGSRVRGQLFSFTPTSKQGWMTLWGETQPVASWSPAKLHTGDSGLSSGDVPVLLITYNQVAQGKMRLSIRTERNQDIVAYDAQGVAYRLLHLEATLLPLQQERKGHCSLY